MNVFYGFVCQNPVKGIFGFEKMSTAENQPEVFALIKNVEKVSSGGLKDWCIDKLEIPAITIEVGNDNLKHPIERKYLNEIFQKNKMVEKDLFFAYNVFRKYS